MPASTPYLYKYQQLFGKGQNHTVPAIGNQYHLWKNVAAGGKLSQ
jgi:hypothetical protein